MKANLLASWVLAFLVGAGSQAGAAGFLDFLRGASTNKASTNASGLVSAGLGQEQIAQGLKEALAKGVQNAVTNLGRQGGFLSNVAVRIPMPENLRKVETTLRKLKQDAVADEFVTTMNRAAESAVPQAAAIFADAIRLMTVEDAKSILKGPEDAATQYFKKAGDARLQEKMLPVVQQATAKAGVTAAYKQLTERAGPALAFMRVPGVEDIDKFVTQKASDGVFTMIAAEEKRIRENPAARTTDLLKKVFGGAGK